MKKIMTFIAIALITMGCRTASSDKEPQTFTAASEKGLAVGTITFDGTVPKNDIYRFFYSPVNAEKKFTKKNDGKIQILGRIDKERAYHGDFNDSKTYLFVIEREPGSYAFTEYNSLNHIGHMGMVNFSPTFSIPFEIKKGEINYIGEFTYIENAEKGMPKILVADKLNRDLTEFKKKFPSIEWNLTQNKTVKTGETAGGMIWFE